MSRLHIPVKDFYELTPVEFVWALNDFNKREQLSVEILMKTIERTSWETTRVTLFHLYNMNPYIKKKIKDVFQVFSLPWDKKEVKQQTPEEMASILRSIHSIFKKKKKEKSSE